MNTQTQSLDLDRLQEALASGQWTRTISGGVPWQLEPDECSNFIRNTERGSLSFSHARWLCFYDNTDQVVSWEDGLIVLDVLVPSGEVHRHEWRRDT